MRRPKISCVIALAFFLHCGNLLAQDWANLKGRFTFDGEPPPRTELPYTALERTRIGAPEGLKLLDESLIVDAKTKGIANVAIFAVPEWMTPKVEMPIHPSAKEGAESEHPIRIKNLAIAPHISVMRSSQQLTLTNEEPFAHNLKLDATGVGPSFNYLLASLKKVIVPKMEQTQLPSRLSGSIAPYLSGYLVVRDNPYFAVTNEKGEFEIKDLPLGNWRFQAWHEKCGYVRKLKWKDVDTTWTKGRFDIELTKNGVDMGEIKVNAEIFKK